VSPYDGEVGVWRDDSERDGDRDRPLPARGDRRRPRPPADRADDDPGPLWHSLSFISGMIFGAVLGAGITVLVFALVIVVGLGL
jgi:hypothetical protein